MCQEGSGCISLRIATGVCANDIADSHPGIIAIIRQESFRIAQGVIVRKVPVSM